MCRLKHLKKECNLISYLTYTLATQQTSYLNTTHCSLYHPHLHTFDNKTMQQYVLKNYFTKFLKTQINKYSKKSPNPRILKTLFTHTKISQILIQIHTYVAIIVFKSTNLSNHLSEKQKKTQPIILPAPYKICQLLTKLVIAEPELIHKIQHLLKSYYLKFELINQKLPLKHRKNTHKNAQKLQAIIGLSKLQEFQLAFKKKNIHMYIYLFIYFQNIQTNFNPKRCPQHSFIN
eukprot:TRINITY_DN5799_c0_g1_i10.p4 TRINITY_DN5799_c0_g1~~TRINITY_DN5799_c0_g1_i10.p4  ORF type:complete len:233 (+),score=-16.53 TRINITY_DN5799_c0_g1_i10:91-789(+)